MQHSANFESAVCENESRLNEIEVSDGIVYHEEFKSDERASDNELSYFDDGADGDTFDDEESDPYFQDEEDKSDSGKCHLLNEV